MERIVVAVDESEAARQGIQTGVSLGERLGVEVILYHVEPRTPALTLSRVGALRELLPVTATTTAPESWPSSPPVHPLGGSPPVAVTGQGLPGIEIPRFAEQIGAGLLVLGRKPRSQSQRLFEGDTADAVVRRSTVPCLFVRRALGVPRRALVAVDGTERGMRVMERAVEILSPLGVCLSSVTVEPQHAGEPAALACTLPTARTVKLRQRLSAAVQPLLVRRGEPAAQILAAALEIETDVIVIGYRRGGPPAVIEAGSVARRVLHHAPCAVLTVPL
jgi:nucleotide-binding universal stress UspA family protein